MINLLAWNIKTPSLPAYSSAGASAKFMPRIARNELPLYKKHPKDLEEKIAAIDPRDASFNYAPCGAAIRLIF